MNTEKNIKRIFRIFLLAFICIGLVYSIMKTDVFLIVLFSLSFLSFLYLMMPKCKKKKD